MNNLEKKLLQAVKFINLKKFVNAGFIVQKNQAIFYSGSFILKFQIDNNQDATRHFLLDTVELGQIYESFENMNTPHLLDTINKYFNINGGDEINLPADEFFDFLDAIFKSNEQIKKYNNQTTIKIESNSLKIENTFTQDSSNNLKELSFEYEINNQQNLNLKINNNFKLFLKFIKQKKQEFNFFAKNHNSFDLFLAKNDNFEVLALC